MALYPRLLNRILKRIRDSFEYTLFNRTAHPQYNKLEKWLTEYFELSEEDHINIVTKVERAQTAGIIYAMRKKDREIFVNQLGCFYIKQTTIDFYHALEKLIGDKVEGEYDFEEVKKSALEETRALYIKRANYAKRCRDGKASEIKFK